MAKVSVNGFGLVFEFDHEETEKVTNGAVSLGGTGGLVTTALAAAGVTAPAALVTAAISAYFGAQAWLIRQVNTGCGVYLTLPWPAIWFGQIYLIVPTTRPCPVIPGPQPEVTVAQPSSASPQLPVSSRWSDRDSGTLHTDDPVDEIGWVISRGAVDRATVQFVLEIGFTSSGWAKEINLPDGQGSSWNIKADGRGATASETLWANQVHNNQRLTFRKPKEFGIWVDVLKLGDLGGLRAGDSVRFIWRKDT